MSDREAALNILGGMKHRKIFACTKPDECPGNHLCEPKCPNYGLWGFTLSVEQLEFFYRAVREQARRELLDEAREPFAWYPESKDGCIFGDGQLAVCSVTGLPKKIDYEHYVIRFLYRHPLRESTIREMERARCVSQAMLADAAIKEAKNE